MACSEKENSPRVDRDCTKARNLNAPISIENLILKEMHFSLEDSDMHEMSVRTDPTNENLTHVKRKIRILNHPKNLIEVLHARLMIAQGLTGNNLTTGTNQ